MKSVTKGNETLDDPANNRRQPVAGLAGVKYATEASNKVTCQALEGRNATGTANSKGDQLPIRQEIKIGTWNIRGLLQPGKLPLVEKEAVAHNVNILGVSETHMRGDGHFTTTDGNTMYFSGHKDKSIRGVGFLIPPFINKYVLGYQPVSDRIITIKLNTRPQKLNIVQVYAPTENAKDEDIDNFYVLLETVLNTIPNREITIILGDWNAKIGDTTTDDHIRSIVGKFGLGIRNDRGQRLIEFCIEKRFSIMNSFFQHHARRLYTWTSPGARYRNQIDYIMINYRWKSSVKNAKTYPGADCGTDHNLLVAKFAIRLKAPKRTTTSAKMKSLKPSERALFRDRLEENLTKNTPPTQHSSDAENSWKFLKTSICNTLDSITKERTSCNLVSKKKNWITDATWSLIQQRKETKAKGLQSEETRKEYSDLSRNIQTCCRRDKNNFILSTCYDIEKHSVKFQTADLFKKVRLLTRQFKPQSWVIEDEAGCPIHELEAIAERWREYCIKLYMQENTDHQTNSTYNMELEPSILRSEIVAAIGMLKKNKAPGYDMVTSEIFKVLGDKGIDLLHNICEHIWQHGDWPQDWTKSIIIPLHKKGSTRKCNNYRTLALISHASKILLHIINFRLRNYLDWQIPQEQAGFVKGKGTREQILNIRQLIEKAYEFDTPIIICFIDYNKAFDCVNWDGLWTILTELGVPRHLITLIQSLYHSHQGLVKVDKTLSKPFKFRKGVRQGCILSPILFNIYGEYIMRKVCDNWHGGISVGGVKVNNLRYADDTTLFAADEPEMIALLNKVESVSKEFGLSINMAKTKVMVVDRTHKLELTGAIELDQINNFVYLGSNISNDGSCELDVKRRIGMAKNAMTKLNKIWTDRNISTKTKRKLVTTLVFSIFLYGSETWTLRKADRMRIDAFEMWCWRKMLSIPWTAYRTNASILKDLKITCRLSTICLRRIFEFFGHVARRRGDNLEKLLVTGKLQGKRPRGRSPMRWSDQIRTNLDTTVHHALHTAQNRTSWKDIIKRRVTNRDHDPQH